jgi:hypothetical protein
MCVSAPMSFVVSTALFAAGTHCARTTVLKRRWGWLPLAILPIVFAFQQLVEGLVWIGLGRHDDALVRWASVTYLYFAIAFYPLWVPFSFFCAEPRSGLRLLFGTMTLLALAWTWLYFPVILHPDQLLLTEVVHHSIRYDIRTVPGEAVVPRVGWRAGYLLLVCVPFLASRARGQESPSRRRWDLAAGTALLVTFIACYLFFLDVFISVWCFVAAALSLLLSYLFARLPDTARAKQEG